jgi:hypothetical protein
VGGAGYRGRVLDRRVYRSAFLPALIAVFVAAFSLADRPAAQRAPGGELFDVDRAFGEERNPPGSSLLELGQSFPQRRPGSEGDFALARRVATELARQRFEVSETSSQEPTADGHRELVTVAGVRPGESTRRIAVLSSRDALGSPALAQLSATAVLLELARVARTRDLHHTLVLVSTSGGSAGAAGARHWARQAAESGGYDAVLVLGDLAGERSRPPWVVPWSNGSQPAPLALRRTVETALRQTSGDDPGGSRAIAQWVRRAFGVTVGEQGEVVAAGLPAVKVSVSGERPPAADAPIDADRMEELGGGVLRALSALDAASGARPFDRGTDGILTLRRVLPTWAVRLLVGVLLLPALVAGFDAYFRVRRRGLPTERWLAWAASGAVALLGAWLLARALGLTRAVAAPPGAAPAGAIPLEGGHLAVLVVAALVAFGGLVAAQPLATRLLGLRGRPRSTGGPAAAVGLMLPVTAVAVWLFNPYLAALLVPAAHFWLLAAAPDTRWNAVVTAIAVAAGLLVPVLAVLQLAGALGMGPVDLAWLVVLGAAGGHVGPGAALLAGVVAGGLLATLAAARARLVVAGPARRGDDEGVVTRGPLGYAGPGSLGGTDSAL